MCIRRLIGKILCLVILSNIVFIPIVQAETVASQATAEPANSLAKKVYNAFGGPLGAIMITAVAVSIVTSGIAVVPAIIIMGGTLALIRLATYGDSRNRAPVPATGTKVIIDPARDY